MTKFRIYVIIWFVFGVCNGQNLIEEKIDQYIDSTRYIGLKDTLRTLGYFSKAKELAHTHKLQKAYYRVIRQEVIYYSMQERGDRVFELSDSLIMQDVDLSFKGAGYLEKGITLSKQGDSQQSIEQLKKALAVFRGIRRQKKRITYLKKF